MNHRKNHQEKLLALSYSSLATDIGRNAKREVGAMSASAPGDRSSGNEIERLLPVLVHIQANLDQDLSLEALATRSQLSPFHFHRLFRSAVGETLKQYTQRLRLERAATRLLMHDSTIFDIALDSGFQSHETFSREFKRRFQVTPKSYREWARGIMRARALSAPGLDELYNDFELSQTRVAHLAQLHVAFIRHVGPYENVPDQLWQQLADWATSKGLPVDLTFLGIAQDAPGLTAPERLRFDAGIVVPEEFSSEGAIGHQVLNAAEFAVTTHVGHYRTFPEAFATIVRRIARMKVYRVGGLPCIEVFHTTRVDVNHEMNHTDIYIPVSRIRK